MITFKITHVRTVGFIFSRKNGGYRSHKVATLYAVLL